MACDFTVAWPNLVILTLGLEECISCDCLKKVWICFSLLL
jgi:hypothetical protein